LLRLGRQTYILLGVQNSKGVAGGRKRVDERGYVRYKERVERAWVEGGGIDEEISSNIFLVEEE
jgi:hypothetical protein